jgi:hypothetical protein
MANVTSLALLDRGARSATWDEVDVQHMQAVRNPSYSKDWTLRMVMRLQRRCHISSEIPDAGPVFY